MRRSLLATCLLLIASGCAARGGTGSTAMPSIFRPPGDIQQQRFNAVAHDPYYDNDAGPEVVGGRPREYQKQLAEPVRNRWLSDNYWNTGRPSPK
jgi:hypothetical protein